MKNDSEITESVCFKLNDSEITESVCFKLFDFANNLWENDDVMAFDIMFLLANFGYEYAYGNLGVMYDAGFGTEKSPESALFWHKKSWHSDAGDVCDCLNISSSYFSLKNNERGLFWLNRAVKTGDAEAKMALVEYKMQTPNPPIKELIKTLDEIIASEVFIEVTQDTIEKAQKLNLKLKNQENN